MAVEERGARRQRSDRKVHIAPYITEAERELIRKITFQLRRRDPDICEGEVGRRIVEIVVYDQQAMDVYFRPYFRRPFRYHPLNLVSAGGLIPESGRWLEITDYIAGGYGQFATDGRSRFKIKAGRVLTERLYDFQIAIGTSYLAHATYALLRFGLDHDYIIQHLLPGFARARITPARPHTNVWSVLGD